MTYDEPVYTTVNLQAASLSAAARLGSTSGPAGKRGRVVAISVAVTTDTTVADTIVSVGDGFDADAYGTLTVPVTTANAVINAATVGTDDTLIPANGWVTIECDGGATAGAGDVTVVIAWF